MVASIVKRGINALTSRQTNIFTAATFIILTTVLSQVLGFLKYRILAAIFGASAPIGIFFAASKVPDLIFQVVITGALSASFIPIFTDFIAHDKKRESFEFTSTLINMSLIFFVIVSAVLILFSYQISSMIAPGFSHDELILMANLMILIQLSQLFFILGTVFTAMLQSYQHFLIPGVATAFINLGTILGLVLFSYFMGFGIYGAAIGTLVGSFLFAVVQLPLIFQTGFKFSIEIHITHAIKKLGKLMVPRSLTLIVSQATTLANVFFASFVSARSLSILEYAQTLAMAPVLLFGQSIAQASFPALSLKSEKKEEFLDIFISSFNQIVYLTLPVSVLLIVLRIPFVRFSFGAKNFDWAATVETGLTLAYFSISITANSLVPLLLRAFYAYKDSKTPFIVTIASVVVNIFFAWLFILQYHLPIHGLALAFSLASILGAVILIYLLNQRVKLPKLQMTISFAKIFVSSFVMGIALYIPIKLLDQLVFDTTRTINLLVLTGIASTFGLLTYLFLTWLFDIKEAAYIVEVLKKFKNRDLILKQIGEILDGAKPTP